MAQSAHKSSSNQQGPQTKVKIYVSPFAYKMGVKGMTTKGWTVQDSAASLKGWVTVTYTKGN